MNRKELMVDYIRTQTEGSLSIVDFGCGRGSRFNYVGNSVKNKIGIDIYKPYIDAKNASFTPIVGNMCDFESLVDPKFYDCAMLIDTLNHIPKEDGQILLDKLQKHFNKIIIMVNDGEYKENQDRLGYGGHWEQTHKSAWTHEELETLNFKCTIHKGFSLPNELNPNGGDNIFATWIKRK